MSFRGAASAQELITLRDLPDLQLYAATAGDLRDDVEPRYTLRAGYAAWQVTSSHAADETVQELSLDGVFGARWRPDRFVQGRARLGGLDDVYGDHRMRAVYGIGRLDMDHAGPIVEADVSYRHGDPERDFGGATEPGRDAHRGTALIRGWLADRVRLCGCGPNMILFPLGYRFTGADFTRLDRTASTARAHEVSSGVGSRLGDGVHVDGWFEWVGVSASRVQIDSRAPLAAGSASPNGPVHAELSRIDLRLFNFNDIVLFRRGGGMSTHRIQLGHTWLWNRDTGRDADVVTGTYGGTVRMPGGNTVGFVYGRNVRLADTADRYYVESRLEAVADVNVGRMGGSARVSASHNAPLGVVAPAEQESFWTEALHTSWHIDIGENLSAGLQHLASLRFVPTGGREWTHYLGAFVTLRAASDDAGTMR